ncbi:helix-turn-helix transcriptional regulator, partial [Kitasatospora sp. NPDC059747]|uniref:helix-turn-helix domain-containing protein n=1 Tax=Kitasatospora sp. NPDC059747 TaxID=3346930 RepID=UPI00364D6F2B
MGTPLLGLPLTPAEATTLRYLTEGYSIADIAHREGICAATVHSRAARARRKLGAISNDHAVQLYAEQQATQAQPPPAPAAQTPSENTMSDPTALGHADAMIEKAWGHPIAELGKASVRHPVEDPLLRAATHTRSHLVVVSKSVAVHQDRLHALTRPGHVPAFYGPDRITQSASALQTAYAESNTALQAISHVIAAREYTLTDQADTAVERVQAATARSTRALGLWACRLISPFRRRPPAGAARYRTCCKQWSVLVPGGGGAGGRGPPPRPGPPRHPPPPARRPNRAAISAPES